MKASELTIKVLVNEPGLFKLGNFIESKCLDYMYVSRKELEVEDLRGMEVDYDEWILKECVNCAGCVKNPHCLHITEVKHYDSKGNEIKCGDLLYNSLNAPNHVKVIQHNHRLYLGDLDSPLERYSTETYWEIADFNSKAD